MNLQHRNELILECTEMIHRLSLSRGMGIREDERDDCKQAGFMAAMAAVETWDEAYKRGWQWMHWAKRYIVNGMIRERNKLRGWGEEFGRRVDLDLLLDMAAASGRSSDESFDDHRDAHGGNASVDEMGNISLQELAAALPRVNEDNEDLEREMLMGDLVEALYELPKTERQMMAFTLTGLSVSEAGRRVGLSQSSADRCYKSVLETLKQKLGVGNSPADETVSRRLNPDGLHMGDVGG